MSLYLILQLTLSLTTATVHRATSTQPAKCAYQTARRCCTTKTSICMHYGRAKKTLKRCIGARALARARATRRADRALSLKGVQGSVTKFYRRCKVTNLLPLVFWPEGVQKHKTTTVTTLTTPLKGRSPWPTQAWLNSGNKNLHSTGFHLTQFFKYIAESFDLHNNT